MKITWLGHSGFRIEIGGEVLLVDPWMTGNPVFPEGARGEAISGATAILLTHGHFDHTADVAAIAAETGAMTYGVYDLATLLAGQGIETTPFHIGGTVSVGAVEVTLVPAVHSSTIEIDGQMMPAGQPAGFVLRAEGHSVYISGDTDVMADMGIIADRYRPDIGILCCGGHFTMDMEGAAYAAKRFFDFRTVIPCHYKTFPLLAQSAQPLADALRGVDVRILDVMESTEI